MCSLAPCCAEGHFITAGPQDLFFTLNQQCDLILNAFKLEGKVLCC